MQILDILSPARVQAGLAATSKKRALELVSELAGKALGDETAGEKVYEALLARERLGSTALGDGVAVPHCRLQACQQAIGLLVHLAEAVDFDAPDGRPVDLLFVLVVPAQSTDEHLQLLGRIATLFNEAEVRDGLRDAGDDDGLYQRFAAFAGRAD